jgi:hypothetical protein
MHSLRTTKEYDNGDENAVSDVGYFHQVEKYRENQCEKQSEIIQFPAESEAV